MRSATACTYGSHILFSTRFERDLELAVIDRDGEHWLVFPCFHVAASMMVGLTPEHELANARTSRQSQQQAALPVDLG
jgi:hypothetical protein